MHHDRVSFSNDVERMPWPTLRIDKVFRDDLKPIDLAGCVFEEYRGNWTVRRANPKPQIGDILNVVQASKDHLLTA